MTLEEYDIRREAARLRSLEREMEMMERQGLAVQAALSEHAVTSFIKNLPVESALYPAIEADCGRLFTAGVTMLNPQSVTVADPMDASSFIPRRGKFIASQYVDLKAQELSLQVESKPLPAPKKDWQWITMLANNTNEVAEGTVGYAIDVDFALAHEEAGVTLPEALTNQKGGSVYTLTIPTATASAKVVNVYLDGVEIASKKAQGSTVNVTLPNEDALVTLDYVTA